jgi:predicted SPOUT superfamily RNA methylase MTH1
MAKKSNKKSVVKTTYFQKGGHGAKREAGDGEEAADNHRQQEQYRNKASRTDSRDHAGGNNSKNNKFGNNGTGTGTQQHRFGRVMSSVPCIDKPRDYTLSIAVPGSIVENCQTRELKTYLVGQLARAAAIYHVDEFIVFDDHLGSKKNSSSGFHRAQQRNNRDAGRKRKSSDADEEKDAKDKEDAKKKAEDAKESSGDAEAAPIRAYTPRSAPHEYMARLLQFCECPQYLRKAFFPMHPDLTFSGLLPPLDAPHHVRVEEQSKYREGVVLDKPPLPNGGSYVNCGIRGKPVEIDRVIPAGIRCTVMLDVKEAYDVNTKTIRGVVVSPAAPRLENGMYWGYSTRLASSIKAVFDECPYAEDGGYDLKVGTSERGDCTVDDKSFSLPKRYKHMLIVFGGVAGIEEVSDRQ